MAWVHKRPKADHRASFPPPVLRSASLEPVDDPPFAPDPSDLGGLSAYSAHGGGLEGLGRLELRSRDRPWSARDEEEIPDATMPALMRHALEEATQDFRGSVPPPEAPEEAALRITGEPSPEEPSERGLVFIPCGRIMLEGELSVASDARALVVVAHAHGLSPQRSADRLIRTLHRLRLGTLFVDLVSPVEDPVERLAPRIRRDVRLLADRMVAVIDWLRSREEVSVLPIGVFATGGAVAPALIAAAERQPTVTAVVACGGSPAMAIDEAPDIDVPVLLLVDAHDEDAADLARILARRLHGDHETVPLRGIGRGRARSDEVVTLSADWLSHFC